MAPLEQQLVDLPFTQGEDTKADALLSAKPSRVENMVVRGGTLQKRYGTSTLTTSTDGGNATVGAMRWWPMVYTDNGQPNPQTKGEAIFPFNNELVRLNGGKAYSLGQATNAWTTKVGTAPILTHSVRPLVRKSSSQNNFDSVSSNGVTVLAWSDNGVHVSVYDEVTGDFYQTGVAALPATAGVYYCRCVALGKKLFVFYTESSAIYVVTIDTGTPGAISAPTTLTTDMAFYDQSFFDAIAYPAGGYVVVAYGVDVGGVGSMHLNLFAVGPAGTVLSSPAKTDMGAAGTSGTGTPCPFMLMRIDANGVGYLFNNTPGVFCLTFNPKTFATITALTRIAPDATLSWILATAEVNPGRVTVFSSGSGAVSGGSLYAGVFIGSAVVGPTGVTTTYANINGTAGLVLQADGFLLNGVACVLAINDATNGAGLALQPTAWVLDSSGNVLAKILPGLAESGSFFPPTRPIIQSNGTISLLVSQQGKTSYTSAAGTIIQTTPHGIARVDLTLAKAGQVPALRFGEAVYIGGSQPRLYDGQQVVESGPNIFPEGVSVSLGATGQLSAGTYSWRVVYTWVNARGEYQRSAPSPAISATATATQKATLTIPTQRLSGRDIAGISTTQIEVYRTEANGINYYRVSSVNSPLLNSTAAATVSFTDNTVTDAALIANELLYTTGGVNDNIGPPGYGASCAHKNRLMLAMLDSPYEWRSSSQAISGEMLRFNEAWGGSVPPSTGPITALASMDGNFIIFTTKAAYLVPGDGPDLLGNNNWVEPQLITSVDAGALSQASVLSSPAGVFCQTARGWKLLSRDLGFPYIGGDLEAYGKLTARCATVRPEVEEVWFQCDSGSDMPGALGYWPFETALGGVALVYNYRYQQWTVLPNYGAQGACYYQGKYTRVRSDGAVFQEQPGTFTDSGVTYASTVETHWVRVGGIQGFQRVWQALVLGLYGSDFTLVWDVAYSYAGQPTAPTYAAADSASLVGNGVFTPGSTFQWRRHLRVQKCEAVKFRFSDAAIGGTGQGMCLSALSLEVGVKRGAYRLPPTQSA